MCCMHVYVCSFSACIMLDGHLWCVGVVIFVSGDTLCCFSIYCYYSIYLLDFIVSFEDIAILPSRARFSTTFLKNCVGNDSLGATTCLKSVVGGK